jgi:phosphatidylserine/phosphatidylglycerophosphate/cardiolipin synthase-like enzyme
MSRINIGFKRFIGCSLLVLLSASKPVYSSKLPHQLIPAYEVCFTPGGNCTDLIINTISKAKESIFVQAYSFTSVPIAKALIDAKKRGVAVNVILDKSQSRKNKYSSAKFLIDYDIPTFIDYKPSIAHNKVMIIDGSVVITGSFNFTKAAQFHNAENLIILHDTYLAKIYLANWYDRQKRSLSVESYELLRS